MATLKKRHLAIRLLRKIGFGILFIVIFINGYILISGRTYIYKGIANTYLKGHMGPTIYDKAIFENATIDKAQKPEYWKNSGKPNASISKIDLAYLNQLKTSSFLVFKNDTLISEHYFGKHQKNTVSNSFSAAKTFVAMLIGCALDEGKIKSLDEPIGNYLPEFKKGKKASITIRHLLMMASGLDWSESGSNPLSDNAASYYGQHLYKQVIDQEVITSPGKAFNYQSGNSQLLGFIIKKATGEELSDYASKKLWSKIGTEKEAYWSLDGPKGAEKAFCCVYGTSRDFGRMGRLILNRGNWNGQQLISTSFMDEMMKNPEMTTDDVLPNHRYGLHIWTYYGDKENPVWYCRGVAGQFIISLPKENIVIVRTGMDRAKSLRLPENQQKDIAYIEKNMFKFGHAEDLFAYIKIGRKMVYSKGTSLNAKK